MSHQIFYQTNNSQQYLFSLKTKYSLLNDSQYNFIVLVAHTHLEMEFNNVRPLFPALMLPSTSHSPLFSQLAQKRSIIKARIIRKDQEHSFLPTKLNLFLHSINHSTGTKMINCSERDKAYLESKQKQKQTQSFEVKVQNPFSKERRHVKLRPIRDKNQPRSRLQLKCCSVYTRKQKYQKQKYKTETIQTKSSVSNLIDQKEINNDNPLRRYEQETQLCCKNISDIKPIENIQTEREHNEKEKEMRFNLQRSKISLCSSTIKKSQGDFAKFAKPLIQYSLSELKHIRAESYCVIESTGQLVLSCKCNKTLQIASLTKIMTAYLIMRICDDSKIDPKVETTTVKSYVQEITGTSAQLIHGDIYTIQQLLYGLLLPSGNDAALVLADWGGRKLLNKNSQKDAKQAVKSNWKNNVSIFVQEMNNYSEQLGLKHTKYGNPHGLPHSEAKSTALDQSKLAAYCLQNTLIRTICQTIKYECQIKTTQSKSRKILWQNTNKLLRRQGFIGMKTGITVTAGPCLITAYKFRQKIYIITVLRSSKVSRRFKDSRKILHWVLMKLYQGETCFEQTLSLEILARNDKYLDSDYSQDEQQFKYGEEGNKELRRRKKILLNQL